jgi:hypothetical protein
MIADTPDDAFSFENGATAYPWPADDESTPCEPRRTEDSLTIDYSKPPVGIVFITSSTSTQNDCPTGEANIGIVIDKKFRGMGYARQAVNLLMSWVFDELRFRRMQAAILDSLERASAQMLFTRLSAAFPTFPPLYSDYFFIQGIRTRRYSSAIYFLPCHVYLEGHDLSRNARH